MFCIQYRHQGKDYTLNIPMAKSFVEGDVVKGSVYVLKQLMDQEGYDDAERRALSAHHNGEVQKVVFSVPVPGFMVPNT